MKTLVERLNCQSSRLKLDQSISDKAVSLSVALEGQASWLGPQDLDGDPSVFLLKLFEFLSVGPFGLSFQRLAAAE